MIVKEQCWCGRVSTLKLDENESENYRRWRRGEIYIQEIGTLNAVEREFLKTGMCKKCQKEIFNNDKSDRLISQ